jgi:hypothetical protein
MTIKEKSSLLFTDTSWILQRALAQRICSQEPPGGENVVITKSALQKGERST